MYRMNGSSVAQSCYAFKNILHIIPFYNLTQLLVRRPSHAEDRTRWNRDTNFHETYECHSTLPCIVTFKARKYLDQF